MKSFVSVFLGLTAVGAPLNGQEWNAGEVTSLVAAAAAQRDALLGTGGLIDYKTRAHGFVFFLAQIGEGFDDPPRMVKVDQLELEVYWKSPNQSKQIILGWRDQVELPTDIRYHRDHLGIVQNNFGDRIRLGDGTEARDVVHPLSVAGPAVYDYAIVDSISLVMPGRTVEVFEVSVRPKDPMSAAVIGSVFLEISDASVVRFSFSFTSAAYLDDDLEDITIVLENGLWDGRFWLPRRQEIEIRRRSAAFDIPLRGIIRARWELTDYEFNLGLADSLFRGNEISAVTPAQRDSFAWENSLNADLVTTGEAAPLIGLDDARAGLSSISGGRLPSGLPSSRLGANSVSDIIRFNRVEGLSVGLGWSFRPAAGTTSGKLFFRYGLDDGDPQGRFSLEVDRASFRLSFGAQSLITDMGDHRVVSGVLGSLLAQEAGRDLGDYYRFQRLQVGLISGHLELELAVQRALGVSVGANPITGTFRNNPYLETGWHPVARLRIRGSGADNGEGNTSAGRVELESGVLDSDPFARLLLSVDQVRRFGSAEIRASGWVGLATNHLPVYRTFVLGGWGTLLGEGFRRWGGRQAVFGHLEIGRNLPLPGVPVGGLLSAGAGIYVAPFVSVGWTGDPLAGYQWLPTDKLRGVVGMVVEPFNGLVRIMLGRNLNEKSFGLTVDITEELWGVL